MNRTQYHHYYLVGIKGVALTSLAQLLVDAGCTVQGCDTAEEFVTQNQLTRLGITPDVGFSHPVPNGCDCVVYTAAHQGSANPVVQDAVHKGIPTYTHAEALAAFFNDKKGIAVCGVGGKSTTSAMISWIMEKSGKQPSYSVGVGQIIGLPRTGVWNERGDYFVAEADEYASNPTEMKSGAKLIPRFQYLQPSITVCTNIAFDHPDVYKDFAHTRSVFEAFFAQSKTGGILCTSPETLAQLHTVPQDLHVVTISSTSGADYVYTITLSPANTMPTVTIFEKKTGTTHALRLLVPGPHNVMNAAYAVAACAQAGIPVAQSCSALAEFRSTKRRFEYVGEKHGVMYYDDYAHHPSELAMVIATLKQWFSGKHTILAFQSHTYSRTKQLFDSFVSVLAEAEELVMIDIFASAREAYDPSVSSDLLCAALRVKKPALKVANVHTIDALAAYFKAYAKPGTICVTAGAGDIYKVHEILE